MKTIKITDRKGNKEYLTSFTALKKRFPDVPENELREALETKTFVSGHRICEVFREIRVKRISEFTYPSYATAAARMHIDENTIRRAVETGEMVNGYTFTCVEEELGGKRH
ncbi:MAG: hypothetical protein ACI4NM_01765 [Bullifex sp.]